MKDGRQHRKVKPGRATRQEPEPKAGTSCCIDGEERNEAREEKEWLKQ